MRPLGPLGSQTWAALETISGSKTRVVIVEKVRRGGEQGDTDIADWIRDVRGLAMLEHPNLSRVRDVAIKGDEVQVTADYLDGARWSELGSRAPRPALETSLRVLVDVLAGLSAMHNLRDARREPLKLVHGELTPDCVIVGLDGMARLVLPIRSRGGLQSGRSGSAYLAPEILLGDESADARADVYGVGAMLWEALSERALFAGLQPSAIVTQLLSGRVPKAAAPAGAPWAAALADVANRALSADPEKRYASATTMAAEIRRIAGVKLPPAVRVAAYVRGAFGDRIQARRQEIERGETRGAFDEEAGIEVDVRVSVAPPEPLPTATTRPPPPVDAIPDGPPPRLAPLPPALPAAFEGSRETRPEVDVVPLAPPAKAPGPPPLRPRLHTLSGVAPPVTPAAEVTGRGTPVVVPSSQPPPPVAPHAPLVDRASEDARRLFEPLTVPVAIEVPRMLPVPADLVQEVAREVQARTGDTLPLSTSPVPAMPPMVMPVAELEAFAPIPQRRRARVALIVLPVAAAVALVVWWLASRTPGAAEATEPLPATTASAPASAPVPAVATSTPTASTAIPEVTPPPPEPAATTTASAATTTPEPSSAPTSAAPAVAPFVPAAPVQPQRPAPRPRYEPEGI